MIKFLVIAFDIFSELMFYLIFIRIVLSWFRVKNRFQILVSDLTDPVLLPFQKIARSNIGLDFSPILAMLTIQLLQYLIHVWTGMPYLSLFI